MPRVNKKGASIHYRGEGDGPTLVLAHSYTNRSETWYERGYVAALKPKYRLVLIDARGQARGRVGDASTSRASPEECTAALKPAQQFG